MTGNSLDPHHRATRGMGGVHRTSEAASNDCRNLLMLCRICHDCTLNDAEGCVKIGWVIERRSGVHPWTVPAKLRTVNGPGWWFLTEDGGYLWDPIMNMIDSPEWLKIENMMEEEQK